MSNNLQSLYERKYYSSVKNLADWFFHEKSEIFSLSTAPVDWKFRADAAWYLSDFQSATELYQQMISLTTNTYVISLKPELENRIREYEKNLVQTRKPISCEDERLRPIMERLSFVFNRISLPVFIRVAKDEADYERFFTETFPNQTLVAYDSFQACGFYYDPTRYWLIFKQDVIDRFSSDDALLGMSAHEMAHLELRSLLLDQLFVNNANNTLRLDFSIEERMTDLYVMSKGLAYPLYCSRQMVKAGPAVLSAEELKIYFESLQRV